MAFDAGPEFPVSGPEPPIHVDLSRPTPLERVLAILEVLICSDYPTQLALGTTFAALGFGPARDGSLSLMFVVLVSLADT